MKSELKSNVIKQNRVQRDHIASCIYSSDILPAGSCPITLEPAPLLSRPKTTPQMRGEFLARDERITHTSTTHQTPLNLVGPWVKIGEYRKCREQVFITVPREGQKALTALLQFASVLTCYNVPPPLDLQNIESVVR